jgi:Domain of unknown function (DUF4118)
MVQSLLPRGESPFRSELSRCKPLIPHRLYYFRWRDMTSPSPLSQWHYSCRLFCKLRSETLSGSSFLLRFVSTWYGGRGPGWLAVAFSTLSVLYFFIPPLRTWILKPHDIPFFLTFVACQVVAGWVSSWRRRTEASLRQAREELERKVAERTIELKNANDALLNQIAERRRTEEARFGFRRLWVAPRC